MANKAHLAAVTALEARIQELQLRLSHAEYAEDTEKAASIRTKLARAMAKLARLKRKARR